MGPRHEGLEQFLARLPELWRAGEVRPTHTKHLAKARTWRTRKDPFEGVWSEVLLWLQHDLEIPAKTLFERLKADYPGRFADGQLRTLQRRVAQWRAIMAGKLLHACVGQDEQVQELEDQCGALHAFTGSQRHERSTPSPDLSQPKRS